MRRWQAAVEAVYVVCAEGMGCTMVSRVVARFVHVMLTRPLASCGRRCLGFVGFEHSHGPPAEAQRELDTEAAGTE